VKSFARVGSDPPPTPAALDWLALDEGERMHRIERYHRLLPARQQPPNLTLHASMHAIVETQLAMGDPAEMRVALDRLLGEGLDRHNAIHALATVLSTHLHAVMSSKASFDAAAYVRDLSEISKERWLASAERE
jgi:hypothetical protein